MKSYGKINLTLDVFPPREDGYHPLCSVFQTISLHDEVDIRPTDSGGIVIVCTGADLPLGEDNLVHKACVAFWKALGKAPQNVEITLHKNIPSCAGLGGGSSNAASVLRLLNQWEQVPLTTARLKEIALTIGADVPFFLEGGTVLVEGIGELHSPLPPLPEYHLLLVQPDFFLSTPKIYGQLDQYYEKYAHNLPTELFQTHKAVKALEEGRELFPYVSNMLRLGTGEHFSAIEALEQELLALGASASCMTGSGSVVFALFLEENKAKQALSALETKYPTVLSGKTVNSTV